MKTDLCVCARTLLWISSSSPAGGERCRNGTENDPISLDALYQFQKGELSTGGEITQSQILIKHKEGKHTMKNTICRCMRGNSE